MSHEIRTPLNGMMVMAELLAGGALPPPQRRYAEIVARSGKTLLRIINDILDLSKIEAGKLELEAGEVRPAELVGEVLGLFFEKAEKKGLDLAARIAPDVPALVEGDPVRLGQILSNLVNNALKFTERGHVLVEVATLADEGGGPGLKFRVVDTGIGIAADKVDKVFEAFSQADQSTTRRYGGTGLGLSISQRLTQAMGGRIFAESVLGEGSRFTFTIAARALADAPRPAAPPALRTARVGAAKPATRAVIAGALAEAGLLVGDDAVADLIVVDAADALLLGGAHPCVVAVAALGDAAAESLAADPGIAAVLARPVTSGDVRRLLVELALPKARAAAARTPAAAPGGVSSVAGLRVLVADDSPVNQEVAREALKTLGVGCEVVGDGEQALRAWRRGGFSVVLMDLSMPVLDGFGATQRIRAAERSEGRARTPIVALTADVAGSVGAWREAGMDAYLSKPFTIRGLAECLGRFAAAPAGEGEGAPAGGAPAPRPAPQGPPLDPDVVRSLRDLAGGSDAILKRILAAFREHAPPRLAGLEAAHRRGDMAAVALEAHALKSPSRNVGALRLAEICADIEQRARGGEAVDAASVAAASDELFRALDAIAAGTADPADAALADAAA
jgi:CheY-like chemotaxis protein/HPt (histidine-containing phosphotransfer) domain-containing protein